jgi:N-acylneuraminate cytidylyltransferase
MRNLAIIPARGGSKRIPRKNIKDFLGKPIIAYSIAAALKSNLFDEVMVSTDDQEIAEIAIKYGAGIPFMRSMDNSDDYATTMDVILEVIDYYNRQDKQFDNVCCIYPTAPLIDGQKLKAGYDKLTNEQHDTVFPVVPFSYTVWRGFKVDSNGKADLVWPEFLNSRSQDLEEIFHDAGQWYWLTANSLLTNKKIFTQNTASLILRPIEAQDIDNLSDWKIAEMKYAYLQSIK